LQKTTRNFIKKHHYMKHTLYAFSILIASVFGHNSTLPGNDGPLAITNMDVPDKGNAISWITGTLPVTGAPASQIIPNTSLNSLNVVKGGSPIYVSNNPEIFTGNGWLMQNARTDATRGGSLFTLGGTNVLYLFHINQSGSTKYIHILASNPNSSAITVTYKGSCYTNLTKPLTGAATGQSYFVAKDWLNNTLPINGTTGSIPQFTVREIFKTSMNNSNMVDGRFEVSATGPAIYYVVITSTGNLTDAINASQGSFAPGQYYTETSSAFGREAGIYATNTVTATNSITLPAVASYTGFCLNTSNKFAPVENQNSAALMTMAQASSQSYGNYGHYYKVTLNITNAGSTARNVKMYFASNVTGAATNATWNGPVKNNGAVFDIYTTLNNPKVQLSSWTINPGTFTNTLEFFVPGLITSNQQLIYQVN
jgi:hypothetical protein